MRRRLSAILCADIVEPGTPESVDEPIGPARRARAEELIRASAAAHSGRIVRSTRDAIMLDFGSSVNALNCALDIQQRARSLNESSGACQPLQVRVGVHVGDVAEEGEELFGSAVDIALRLMQAAPPEGICISREVQVQIRPVLPLQYLSTTLKAQDNTPEPIEAFLVQPRSLSVSAASDREGDATPAARMAGSTAQEALWASMRGTGDWPPTLLQRMLVPRYMRRDLRELLSIESVEPFGWIAARAALYVAVGALLSVAGNWFGHQAGFHFVGWWLDGLAAIIFFFAIFSTWYDFHSAMRQLKRIISGINPGLQRNLDGLRERHLLDLIPLFPEPIKGALERAKAADHMIHLVSEQPSWKRAGITADGYYKQSHAQLLSLIEWGKHLVMVGSRVQRMRAERPERQEIETLYQRQCASFEAAAGMFEKAQAALTRASLATSARSQAGHPPEAALQEMAATFDALAEIIEAQAELPETTKLTALGE